LAAEAPLVVVFEDLHWADDASLDAIPRLVSALAAWPALVVGNARPTLLQRRPLWGEGERQHVRIDLQPLGAISTRRLIASLLEAPSVSDDIVAFVRDRSEGNAFFIEELVQMLLHRGALRQEAEGWVLDAELLERAPVPTTLQGMLQARLDTLLPAEKSALQRAAVIGRIFWEGALVALGVDDREVLDRLRGRGLLFARERSSFPGEREFLFRHALLADAAYSTLLKRERPALHRTAADWLREHAGERYPEFAGQIGEHCENARQPEEAAVHFAAAAEAALAAYGNRGAVDYYTRALDLAPEAPAATRFGLLKGRELALDAIGDRNAQGADLQTMAQLAADLPPPALSYTHFRASWFADRTGDHARAESEARAAIEAAGDDRPARAGALINLGNALLTQQAYADARARFAEAMAIYEAESDERGAAKALLGAASADEELGDAAAAEAGLRRGLAFFESADDLRGQAICHTNWGVLLARQDTIETAEPHFRAALDLYRAAGDRAGEAKALSNLALCAKDRGDIAGAEAQLREGLAIFRAVSNRAEEIDNLLELADVLEEDGRADEAEALRLEAAKSDSKARPRS
jgi:tetratricopeptide (TPR) repeat protein